MSWLILATTLLLRSRSPRFLCLFIAAPLTGLIPTGVIRIAIIEVARCRLHSRKEAVFWGHIVLNWPQILAQFPSWRGAAEPDSYRDFLGVRTRMRYMPPPYMALCGTVQGEPGTDRAGLHDIPEWAGVLQSVLDARGRFACAELGAGYGPFVVGAALAARGRGIGDINLVAVEGAQTHIDFMREHFTDNSLNADDHHILCGVVGTYDGAAVFPRLSDPSTEWGAEAFFGGAASGSGRTPQMTIDAFEDVPCYSLATILAEQPYFDVVHFDIQGSECDVIEQGISTLRGKVRRIVVGTHGRDLEHRLAHFMDGQGWTLEMDKACSYQQQPPHGLTLLQDGVQVWRNLSPVG
jgi:FkbM family methyltransferase